MLLRASGYNPQYLRRLLRQGRLAGIKIDQQWLISLESFDEYLGWSGSAVDRRRGPQGLPAGEVAS